MRRGPCCAREARQDEPAALRAFHCFAGTPGRRRFLPGLSLTKPSSGFLLLGHLLALLACLGEADRDRLLAALDLAALAAAAALCLAFLVAAHLILDVALRAFRIF